MGKLNQVLAKEQRIKKDHKDANDNIYKALQKSALFDGQIKTYNTSLESSEGAAEIVPNVHQKVQMDVQRLLGLVAQVTGDFWDITLTKDVANTVAFADVIIDDEVLVERVPATFLLWMDKQLIDVHTEVSKIPTLDPAERWEWDEAQGNWRSDAVRSLRTKKINKPIVLYEATDKHPAQVQMVTEDVTTGTWDTMKLSGALPVPQKEDLVRRVSKLRQAILDARERANMTEAANQKIGDKLFGYLFANVTSQDLP